MDWFTVDKEGLAKLLADKGPGWILYELIQNAWDTDAFNVRVKFEPLPGKPYSKLTVEDDARDGFKNLTHAWTLFAESEKKGDPTLRGRFNMGEKMVLAMCEEASITSTTGTVRFDKTGRHVSAKKQPEGSTFSAVVRLTRAQHDEACEAVRRLLPPPSKNTWFNDVALACRERIGQFEATLPTILSDAEGNLRRTARRTEVNLYTPAEGETATLYEMGIPVVELTGGEPWHIDVQQKIPLNSDRDNVTPAYLRELRTYVLNHMHAAVKGKDEAAKTWVREAMADPRITREALETAKTEAFGKHAVVYDPSDPQANKAAMADGATVIPGGALAKGAWDNIKRFELALPAGRLYPTDPEETEDAVVIPREEWTRGMKDIEQLVLRLAAFLIEASVSVVMINNPRASVAASWGNRCLTFNVGRLGKKWFDEGASERVVALILHEFAHHRVADHLSEDYYRELCRLGAKLARVTAVSQEVQTLLK